MTDGSNRWSYRNLRDAVITVTSLGGLVHEVLADHVRPELLLLIGSLLAVPAFLRADERLRNRDSSSTTATTTDEESA